MREREGESGICILRHCPERPDVFLELPWFPLITRYFIHPSINRDSSWTSLSSPPGAQGCLACSLSRLPARSAPRATCPGPGKEGVYPAGRPSPSFLAIFPPDQRRGKGQSKTALSKMSQTHRRLGSAGSTFWNWESKRVWEAPVVASVQSLKNGKDLTAVLDRWQGICYVLVNYYWTYS